MTAFKRRSACSYITPGIIAPTADNDIDSQDRAQVAGFYAGIAATSESQEVSVLFSRLNRRLLKTQVRPLYGRI